MTNEKKMERVCVYVDGFNLYFGMVEAGFMDCKWLDIRTLALSCLKPGQALAEVVFFTSSITNNAAKEKRQRTYLDALEATGVKIVRGKYESKTVVCEECEHSWSRTNEKMTDVNIALRLIMDAVNDVYDTAILISGDSDLVPGIQIVNNDYKPKKVVVFFPPKRTNDSVKKAAIGSFILGRKKLKDCQFPPVVLSLIGYELKRPAEWAPAAG